MPARVGARELCGATGLTVVDGTGIWMKSRAKFQMETRAAGTAEERFGGPIRLAVIAALHSGVAREWKMSDSARDQ